MKSQLQCLSCTSFNKKYQLQRCPVASEWGRWIYNTKQSQKTPWVRSRLQHQHKPSQPRAVPAHLLSASTRSPRCLCPVSQASYSSSIKPAFHYHFHLRLQIQKLPPLTAKRKKIEVKAQSAAKLGKVHGDIQKKSCKEAAWAMACFCPNYLWFWQTQGKYSKNNPVPSCTKNTARSSGWALNWKWWMWLTCAVIKSPSTK